MNNNDEFKRFAEWMAVPELGKFIDWVWQLKQEHDVLLAAQPAQGQQVECQECERLRAMLTDWEADANLLEKERDEALAELSALKAQQVGQEPTVKDCLTVQPVAYAVFAENGNIRIWCSDPIQAETLRQQYGAELRPLYTAPQPAPAQDVAGLYTCEGKGGEYARIGTSLGAGEGRGEIVEVYRDTSSGQLYHRESADFFVRMKPVSHDKQSGEVKP